MKPILPVMVNGEWFFCFYLDSRLSSYFLPVSYGEGGGKWARVCVPRLAHHIVEHWWVVIFFFLAQNQRFHQKDEIFFDEITKGITAAEA